MLADTAMLPELPPKAVLATSLAKMVVKEEHRDRHGFCVFRVQDLCILVGASEEHCEAAQCVQSSPPWQVGFIQRRKRTRARYRFWSDIL